MNLTIGNNTMSSREIAELTGKRHDNVLQLIRKLVFDKILSPEIQESVFYVRGKPFKEFLPNKRDSLIIVSRLSPEFTAAVIDRWQELESAVQTPAALPDFSNPAEAARAWAEQYEISTAAQEQLQIAAPKIEFHDSIVNDSQTFSTRDAAKKIQQRPIKFGEWLKINGYLCLNGRAAQKYIDMGLFVTHTGISESDHAYTQTRMTGKGCAYFNNKLFEVKL